MFGREDTDAAAVSPLMAVCTLCELPTPDPTLRDPEIDGSFCCRGCLEVSKALAEIDAFDAEAVRERSRATDDASQRDRELPDGDEAFLAIDGMHCTACEGFVALQAERHDGIALVEASYATDVARVVYDGGRIDRSSIPELLSGAGYVAHFPEDGSDSRGQDEETIQRLLVGGFCTLLLMPWYLFWLYPSYVGIETGILTVDATTSLGLYIPMAFIGVLTSVVLFYTGFPVLRGAYVSLRAGRPNMDLLITIAAGSAYAYSTVALTVGSTHLYYDVSVAVIMVVTLGKYYEGGVKRRTTDVLSSITTARVDEARRRVDGRLETVPIGELSPGDELVVRPGERIPIDGEVVDGVAAVDESILTGESLPKTRGPGESVVGGSIVTDNALVVRVGAGAESTLDRIAGLLWSIQSGSSGTQRLVDKLSTIFVPLVLVLATVVVAWRLVAGSSVAAALLAGLTVLVVSCPCAMGLATPLAVAGGLRDALVRGLVITNESLFETAPDVETVVFDKTGTLTTGSMSVREVVGEPGALRRAAAVERFSDHPAATAICDHVDAPLPDATAFERHPGDGVSAVVDGCRVVVGTADLVEREAGELPPGLEDAVERARSRGALPVVIGWDGRARSVAIVGDEARDAWDEVLASFAGRDVVVLTGDDESATERVREHPAVDRVFAGVPPDGKVATVERLRATGPVAMIGDGTNDAPALAAADVGIALGSGTAHASDAADVVITTDDLTAVSTTFEVASGTRRRLRENVCWAFCYNGIAIPLAVAGLINPLFAALAMAGSSAIVVYNSSRSVLPGESAFVPSPSGEHSPERLAPEPAD